MSDTFSRSCGPSTSNGYNRGSPNRLFRAVLASLNVELSLRFAPEVFGDLTESANGPQKDQERNDNHQFVRHGVVSGGVFLRNTVA